MASKRAAYHLAPGLAVMPCSNALIQTVFTANINTGSASSCSIFGTTNKAKRAVAKPRGPNYPKNKRVVFDASVPISESQIARGLTMNRLERITARTGQLK